MTLKEYQDKALGTAVFPPEQGIWYTALGICGEAGEYAEKVKKRCRDGVFDPNAAVRELGDILWYVNAAAHEIGFTLEDVARINLEKLEKRMAEGKLKGNGDNR